MSGYFRTCFHLMWGRSFSSLSIASFAKIFFCLTIDQTIGRRAITNIKIYSSSFCSPMIMIMIMSYQQETHLSNFFLLIHMQGSVAGDAVCAFCCGPCASCQTQSEIKQRGDHNWKGKQERRRNNWEDKRRISPIPHPTQLRTYKGFSPLQSWKRSNFKGLRFETLEGPISIPTPPTNQCPSEAFEVSLLSIYRK